MKTLMTFFAAAALTLAAGAPVPAAETDTAAPAPAQKKTAVTDTAASAKASAKTPAKTAYQPLTVPKDAVANGNGGFDYTDKAGNQWVYTNTPFGVTRAARTGSGPAGGALTARATDLGDTVRFEQSTPFGTKTWEKKKADLTDEERRTVESQTAAGAPGNASHNTATQSSVAGQN